MIYYKALKQLEIFDGKIKFVILKNELLTWYEISNAGLLSIIDLFQKVQIPDYKITTFKNSHRFESEEI